MGIGYDRASDVNLQKPHQQHVMKIIRNFDVN